MNSLDTIKKGDFSKEITSYTKDWNGWLLLITWCYIIEIAKRAEFKCSWHNHQQKSKKEKKKVNMRGSIC